LHPKVHAKSHVEADQGFFFTASHNLRIINKSKYLKLQPET